MILETGWNEWCSYEFPPREPEHPDEQPHGGQDGQAGQHAGSCQPGNTHIYIYIHEHKTQWVPDFSLIYSNPTAQVNTTQ